LYFKGCQTEVEGKKMVDAFVNVRPSSFEKERNTSCCIDLEEPTSSPLHAYDDSNDETYSPNGSEKSSDSEEEDDYQR
jgi:hypothetical protein